MSLSLAQLGNVVVWRTRGGAGAAIARARGGVGTAVTASSASASAAAGRVTSLYDEINERQRERKAEIDRKVREIVDMLPQDESAPSTAAAAGGGDGGGGGRADGRGKRGYATASVPQGVSHRRSLFSSAASFSAFSTPPAPSSPQVPSNPPPDSSHASHMDTFELLSRDDALASVDSYGDSAFIVNGVLVSQSIIAFGGTSLLWDVATLEDVNVRSAAALTLIKPVPEIVIIGCGERPRPAEVDAALLRALRAQGSAVEVMSTAKGAALFNILNQEGRRVAAALLSAGR